ARTALQGPVANPPALADAAPAGAVSGTDSAAGNRGEVPASVSVRGLRRFLRAHGDHRCWKVRPAAHTPSTATPAGRAAQTNQQGASRPTDRPPAFADQYEHQCVRPR